LQLRYSSKNIFGCGHRHAERNGVQRRRARSGKVELISQRRDGFRVGLIETSSPCCLFPAVPAV
jgi:hypothetical protein